MLRGVRSREVQAPVSSPTWIARQLILHTAQPGSCVSSELLLPVIGLQSEQVSYAAGTSTGMLSLANLGQDIADLVVAWLVTDVSHTSVHEIESHRWHS